MVIDYHPLILLVSYSIGLISFHFCSSGLMLIDKVPFLKFPLIGNLQLEAY